MFHSDRGPQYTAFSFRQLLDSLNVVPSFSKKISPFDNACCECFFKYLKKEQTNRKCYHSLQKLQLSIFEYIRGYYNSKKPNTTLHMLTPNEAKTLYWEQDSCLLLYIFYFLCYSLDYSSYQIHPQLFLFCNKKRKSEESIFISSATVLMQENLSSFDLFVSIYISVPIWYGMRSFSALSLTQLKLFT